MVWQIGEGLLKVGLAAGGGFWTTNNEQQQLQSFPDLTTLGGLFDNPPHSHPLKKLVSNELNSAG